MIWYVYPMWHRVSFTLIAERHVAELRKHLYVYSIDETAIPAIQPATSPLVVLHPYFYPMTKYGRHLQKLIQKVKGFIGIDVADSDRISRLAVDMTHYAEAMVVPSHWARQSYVSSGVKTPVYVVPHGLDQAYWSQPKRESFFARLWDLKRRRKLTYLLSFYWHSDYRKGMDLVASVYRQVRRERKDIMLVAKVMSEEADVARAVKELGGVVVSGWLTEEQKIELYDLADVYLLFSRGGGFELNGLEALARGEVVLAASGGPWAEYLPAFSMIPSRRCPWVLKDNAIHVGGGREVIVDKAVSKICDVLDNLDEYKAKVREHVEKNIKGKFTWENTGRMLASILRRHLG